jgi:hypothetical protein
MPRFGCLSCKPRGWSKAWASLTLTCHTCSRWGKGVHTTRFGGTYCYKSLYTILFCIGIHVFLVVSTALIYMMSKRASHTGEDFYNGINRFSNISGKGFQSVSSKLSAGWEKATAFANDGQAKAHGVPHASHTSVGCWELIRSTSHPMPERAPSSFVKQRQSNGTGLPFACFACKWCLTRHCLHLWRCTPCNAKERWSHFVSARILSVLRLSKFTTLQLLARQLQGGSKFSASTVWFQPVKIFD